VSIGVIELFIKNPQYPYLLHKYEILKALCGSEPLYSKVLDKRNNCTYERYYFNTLGQPDFKFYAHMFYTYDKRKDKWVKDVPLDIKKY
jgi:hypothetical protein